MKLHRVLSVCLYVCLSVTHGLVAQKWKDMNIGRNKPCDM